MANDNRGSFGVPLSSQVRKTGVRLGFVNSVPTMMAGETPFWQLIYTFDPYKNRPYLKSLESMYKHGVRLFTFLVPLPVAWDRPGEKYDFSLLDQVHDAIFAVAPEALLIPRVFMTTPDWWDEEYPEELIGFKTGRPAIPRMGSEELPLWKYNTKIYHDTKNPSMASRRWRKDASAALSAYVRHTWEKYPGRFIGYQPAYGTCVTEP